MMEKRRRQRTLGWRLRRLRTWLRYEMPERILGSRVVKQVIVSLCLLGIILGLRALPFAFVDKVLGWLYMAVTEEYDFVAVMRRIPSVEQLGGSTSFPFLIPFRKQPAPTPDVQTMIWPVEGRLTSGFGWRAHPDGKEYYHEGIDIEAPEGTPILACLDGVVVSAAESEVYGKVIVLDHGEGLQTLYAHCSELLVRPPQRVKQGDVIARVGQTGNATAPHLHFEVRVNGIPEDPGERLSAGVKGP